MLIGVSVLPDAQWVGEVDTQTGGLPDKPTGSGHLCSDMFR